MLKENYIYRYRSIDSLNKYGELENLSIYFAKPEELNDQMEGYTNIIWQGDNVAFQGLFKHYLYVLTHLYYEACLRNEGEKLDVQNLPIFLTVDALKAPEMNTLFKEIYLEFFNSSEVASIPLVLGNSNKKITIDEMSCLFQVLQLYAYLVINTQVKKQIFNKNLLQEPEYNEIYNIVKHWRGYREVLKLLISSTDTQSVVQNINELLVQQRRYKEKINTSFANKDNFNINVLVFDFPELYIKQIRKLLYPNWCVACFSATYQNEAMWSHYADKENGICIRYKTNCENNSHFLDLYTVVGAYSSLSRGEGVERCWHNCQLIPILYDSVYPEINFFTSLGCLPIPIITGFMLCNYDQTKLSTCFDAYNLKEQWRAKYYQLQQQYVCTKSAHWAYEEEYRVFLSAGMSPIFENKYNRLANYKIENVDAIIFGRSVTPENKRKIIGIIQQHCKEKSIPCCKFYDLYYSSLSHQLEKRLCVEFFSFSGVLKQ